MKSRLTVALGLILASSAAWPQQKGSDDAPASKQDVERLIVVMHVRERIQLIMENSRRQSKPMFEEILRKELPEANGDELAQMQHIADQLIDDIHKDYPIDAVIEGIVPVYQKHLTKSDCEGVIGFYSSPLGQKLLRELPAVTSETMEVSNSLLQPRMEDAIKQFKDRVMQIADEDRRKQKAAETKPATK